MSSVGHYVTLAFMPYYALRKSSIHQRLFLDTCVTMPCLNGGECISVPSPTANTNFTCKCANGYYGAQCEISMHCTLQNNFSIQIMTGPCEFFANNNPNVNFCQNGGTCQNTGSQAYCKCKTGYTGQKCDQRMAQYLPFWLKLYFFIAYANIVFIETTAPGCTKADILFIIDSSASLGSNWLIVKQMVKE